MLVNSTLLSIAFAAANCTTTSYAPIPTDAQGPQVPNDPGYRLEDFGDGAYMVTNGVYQAMFLVGCESVIVVDSPPTIGQNMMRAIRDVTSLPISHVVYSHSHVDHIGTAYLLGDPSNVTFIAHVQTADLLAMTPDEYRPAPSVTFDDTYNLQICNQSLELKYMGLNHEPGNIFIYAPLQKVLMLVDIVYPGWVPFYELGVAHYVPGYIKAHDQILSYDFDHFVGGHLNRAGTRQDVFISQEYVVDLYNASVTAVQLSRSPNSTLYAPPIQSAVLAAEPGNSWLAFETVNSKLSDYVYEVTSAKWAGKLAGLDVYGESNAETMLEAVMIDWGV